LTEDEVKKMTEKVERPRDSALIMTCTRVVFELEKSLAYR